MRSWKNGMYAGGGELMENIDDDREMIKMKQMTINGIGGKVHYWISRPNNNSKGALVFTHGLTANHTMYCFLCKILSGIMDLPVDVFQICIHFHKLLCCLI